jgi:hypothetical protein
VEAGSTPELGSSLFKNPANIEILSRMAMICSSLSQKEQRRSGWIVASFCAENCRGERSSALGQFVVTKRAF